VNIAKATGSGFVEYMWPKPGSLDPVEKLSYVSSFKAWGWVFGTGIYMTNCMPPKRNYT
jgi:methyl-accepting chemotaxis protein